MQHVSVNTPELSIESLEPYDKIYPICGMDWYSHKKVDINLTNLNINIDGKNRTVAHSHAVDQQANMDVDNENNEENN